MSQKKGQISFWLLHKMVPTLPPEATEGRKKIKNFHPTGGPPPGLS
jgi:hypothetical protein